MNKITISDNRTDKSFDPVNMQISITNVVPQTLQVVDDKGDVSEQTFNVLGTAQTTTPKDLQADLDNLNTELATAQAHVDTLTQQIADKQDLLDQVNTQVETAFEALPAVVVEPSPVEKLPPETLPVNETLNEIPVV
jgi:predicted  nucleic acid-binding Zn-ribbon protein